MTSAADTELRSPAQMSSVPMRGWRWLRANLFSSVTSSLTTLVLAAVLAKALIALVRWGILDAIWKVPTGDSSACRAARGLGACWAVIPEKYRFILFGTSVRAALAPGGGNPGVPRALRGERHAPLLDAVARAAVGGGAGADRRADVGRRVRPALRRERALGRPDAHADPRDLRPRARVPAGHPARARPALGAAGAAHRLRRLRRAHPRRAAHQPAVHGLGDAAAVPAGGRHDRQAAARAAGAGAVRRRVPRRGGARRAAGDAAPPGRNRGRARLFLVWSSMPT